MLGLSVEIDGEAYTVIGVAPSGFSEVWRLDVWLPLGLFNNPANRQSNYLLTFGRMRDGMTLEARGAAWENWPRRCLAITRSTNTRSRRGRCTR